MLLGYEAVLASTPPNNMDSLTYHLARAAAWTQHGGIYWIANAPEVELNAYQPFAELQDFFLMVATGGGRLYALPQYLAELAILVSVYGSARRLGYAVRPSTCAAALAATFSVLALEAVTGQNDLFAASFPAVAACLLLGAVPAEAALAGAAVAFGIGTKLTTGLVVPILAWLALARGRRTFVTARARRARRARHDRDVGVRAERRPHRSHLRRRHRRRAGPGESGLPAKRRERLLPGLRADGYLGALVPRHPLARARSAWCWRWLRRACGGFAADTGAMRSSEAAGIALPFLAPLLVVGGAALVAWGARAWGFPIRGPGGLLGPLDANLNETYTRIANEDYSAYGPVGIVALLAAAVLAVRRVRARPGRHAPSRTRLRAAGVPRPGLARSRSGCRS